MNKRLLLLGGFACAALNLIMLVRIFPGDPAEKDFRQLYAGGYTLHIGQGKSLYDSAAQRAIQKKFFSSSRYVPFLRPAYEALVFKLASFLRYRTAYFGLLGLNLALLAVLAWILSSGSIASALVLTGIIFSFTPVSHALLQGQDSIALTVILAACWRALENKKPLLAGMLAGLGLFKFQLILPICLLFLIWRRWRFCQGFALSAVVVLSVSTLIIGIHGWWSYFLLLRDIGEQQWVPIYRMANLRGLVVAITGGIPQSALVATNLLVAVLLALVLPRPRRDDDALFLAIVAGVLCSYYVLSHDLCVLLVPIVGVLGSAEVRKATARSAALLQFSPIIVLQLTATDRYFYLVAVPLVLFGFLLALDCRRPLAETGTALLA